MLHGMIWLLYLLDLVASQVNLTIDVPAEYAYLLPRPFNNSFTQPFIDTTVPPGEVNETITTARSAIFISYDQEFSDILGQNPTVQELASSESSFAFEGGAWVASLNQIWFTAFLDPTPGYLSILDLNTSTVFRPNLTGPAANVPINPNGLYFFNDTVFLTSFGDPTTSPTIVAINPYTYETTEIVNSFYGLPLNGPNDVVWAVSQVTDQPCMFYSDFYFAAEGLSGTWQGTQELPNAVWRWKPEEKSLQMVISPLDVQTPNGLAVDQNSKVLYVTDGPDPAVFGRPYTVNGSSSPGLYKYDLAGEDGCTPVNRRLIGIARQGFSNGVKVDDNNRTWTAEYEGVVVRNSEGKVLGLINAIEVLRSANITDVATLANFAIARDELIWLGFNKIFSIKLAQIVKSWY